eukprot:TRINITY_DN67855_c0_g1_i1.p1 TRINITY_DN67855_c0_g1~~TRINITY_DN67855_c0_g1_i1.p1  ORF type:complete len:518 (-),score=119.87 TRINITY_DN67855_c0_g1_i1:16-1521(-)
MARVTSLLLVVAACTVYVGPGFVGHRQLPPGRIGRRPDACLSRHAGNLGEAFELPPDKVVEAVSKAGQRVTAADVAAAGGLSLAEARKGVVALAGCLGADASLEVSKTGELVYLFPSDVQAALSKASSAAAAREAWNNAKPALFTALRIAFGVALFASIAVIYAALLVISTSGSSEREDRDDRRGYRDEGGFGGGFGFGPSLYFGPSPFDLFFYRPYYSYGGYSYYDEWEPRPQNAPPKMGFLESVYSFVFGDGDPNDGREERSLAAVAATARRNGGVLTAEQLAPLLDPPAYASPSSTINVDESWVLPALARLNGRPEVAKDGQIVYVFDDLQTTAGESSQRSKPPPILEEQEVPFSLADEGQLFMVVLLGVANLVGAAYLGAQLASLPAGVMLPGWLGAVQSFYPALLAYAVGFFAAPALRYAGNGSENSEIASRNEHRKQWLDVLRSGQVDGKLAEARSLRSSMRQIGEGDTVYSTAKDSSSQSASSDLDDFDRRLKS